MRLVVAALSFRRITPRAPCLAVRSEALQQSHQAQLELPREFVGRQVAFEPVTLRSFRIGNDHGWRLLYAGPVEPGMVFLDMNFDGNEILLDEPRYLLIRVHLCIQPSAGPSHWGSTKV